MRKILLTLFSVLFILAACDNDIFDRQPLDKISDAVVWDDPIMLRAYLNDVQVRLPYNNRLSYNGPDTKTDIATQHGGNQNAITMGTMSRTSEMYGLWNYGLIRDINIFIEKIVDAPILQSLKEQMEGEARVFRAMMYFEMQQRYGGVPLVDIPLDPFNPIDQKYTRRSTEEAIADFIDADLTVAVNLLPDNPKPVGRINKWSAYALKARANLWAASIAKYGSVQINGLVGIPSGRANEFYTKASAAANEVILSGHYALYNQHADKSENYRKLFLDENNGEAIFMKLYDGVNIFHSWTDDNIPQSLADSRGSRDNPLYDYILATENIDGSTTQPLIGPDHLYDYPYQAFENKDPRIKASLFFDGDAWAGHIVRTYEGIDPSPVPNPNAILSTYGLTYNGMPQVASDSRLYDKVDKRTLSGFLVKKYISEAYLERQSKNPWMEFRLAEMYLIRAESEFELGNLGPAATALNATRERAGISLVDASSITRDHVRTERMSEMFMEQQRWWDLRRWRIAEEVLNLRTMQGLRIIYHFESGKTYYLPVNAELFSRTFLPQHYYNPITDGRINNNVDLVENPGY